MKCKRCNLEIKKGELFCSNCGAKVVDDVEHTTSVDLESIDNEKNIKEDVKDLFYKEETEKRTNGLNVFLIILIFLLIGGIIYLVFFDNYIIKRNNAVFKADDNYDYTVYYNDISFILPRDMKIQYKDNRVYINKEGLKASLYMVDEDYDRVLENINEMILKWNELGLKINEHKEDNTIYELLGTYQYNNYALYFTKLEDKIVVLETSFDTVDIYEQEKNNIKQILNTIAKKESYLDIFMYPEFNLDPLGSQ